jgi:hypothetical protein
MLGIAPSTMILLLFIITQAANLTARAIPETATGWKGTLRKVCSVVGLYMSSRIAPGVTVNDVAKAAAKVPPIPQIVEAEKVAEAPGNYRPRE